MSTFSPLAGIRVLDLSRVLAGPWATQFLADLGAEIIKIERPGSGDDTRGWGPPFVTSMDGRQDISAYFLSANRGKQSVTIDLAKPAGQQLVRDLAVASDVIVENFKVGGLAALGLGPDELRPLNPRLIVCSITGFGQDGPHSRRPGYDLLVQAMGGLMSITGEADGPPIKVGVALADIMTGMYAASAILAALIERQTSGKGHHIDLALLDVQITTLANQAMNYLVGGKPPKRQGNAHPNIVPYQAFPTSDGHIVIAVGNDAQFARFAQILGVPELAQDERFATNAQRVVNRTLLIEIIASKILLRKSGELLGELETYQIPTAPINDMAAVFADPQIEARGLLLKGVIAAGGGAVSLLSNPIRIFHTSISSTKPPPLLSEDTDSVLSILLGRSAEQITKLRLEGII